MLGPLFSLDPDAVVGMRSRGMGDGARQDAPAAGVDGAAPLCERSPAMAKLGARDLSAEIGKHFAGTPLQRLRAALRLGEEAVDLFLATLPAGTTRRQARAIMQRNRHRGRRRSKVANPSGA